MRFFIEFSYRGDAYHGWQRQPNAITIQETLENALSILLNQKLHVVGAGRTDAGVHAKQMFAHFDISTGIDEDKLIYKLNSFLPDDIAIFDIFRVSDNAHARFNAIKRTYIYKIATQKNPLILPGAYYIKQKLNVISMREASQTLLLHTDFQCFSKKGSNVNTYNCNLMCADWNEKEGELIFTITANRFLRNMVRAIVGTLINVGIGKWTREDLLYILKSRQRSNAGYSVPAKGLYLQEISYPKEIRNV